VSKWINGTHFGCGEAEEREEDRGARIMVEIDEKVFHAKDSSISETFVVRRSLKILDWICT
jgi:hypothetical protein